MSAGDRLRAAFSLDLRSLALFRAGLGLCVLLDLVTRAVDMRPFYTDFGVLPRPLLFRMARDVAPDRFWSFHAATGSALGEGFLFLVAAACACALVVGWRTRAAAVASLVLAISLQDRNPAVFYGFDLLLRTALLWACFLPLGARFSVDAQRGRAPATGDVVLSAGTAAFTVQMAAIYLFSGIQKLEDPSWRELTAGFFAVTTDNHATALARALAGHPDGCRALAAATLVVELLGPALLFVPVRRARVLTVAVFVAFHAGTALLFTLGLFPLAGVCAWLAFVPGDAWDKRPVAVDARRAPALVAGAVLCTVLAFNLETVTGARLVRGSARDVALVLHLDQTWNMFVHPLRDGWFVAPATLADGRVVDVLTRGKPVTFDKPASVSAMFPSMRWRKYVTDLIRPADARHRLPFLRYLCRGWNAGATTPGERMQKIDLWFVEDIERVDGAAPTQNRELLGRISCDPLATAPTRG